MGVMALANTAKKRVVILRATVGQVTMVDIFQRAGGHNQQQQRALTHEEEDACLLRELYQ